MSGSEQHFLPACCNTSATHNTLRGSRAYGLASSRASLGRGNTVRRTPQRLCGRRLDLPCSLCWVSVCCACACLSKNIYVRSTYFENLKKSACLLVCPPLPIFCLTERTTLIKENPVQQPRSWYRVPQKILRETTIFEIENHVFRWTEWPSCQNEVLTIELN